MATAALRGSRTCNPCELCHCQIDDTRNRRNLGTKTSECATTSLDRICRELGAARIQLVPGPVCKRCFQDLEKLTKAQSMVDHMRARFAGYLRSRTSTVTVTTPPRRLVASIPGGVPRKRSAADISSPVCTSTPSGRSPVRKRPLLVREESSRARARKSLAFGLPEPQAVPASPVVNVVEVSETGGTTEKKIYRVSSTTKRVTMHLAKGNYTTFARNAVKIPPLRNAIVAAIAAEVRSECQQLCTTTEGRTSVLRQTSANEVKKFNWSDVIDELRIRTPVFFAILEASVKRFNRQHPKKVSERSIGFAAAVLLHERNNFMCAAQCINSIMLHSGHASKMVYTRMRSIGICLSHRATLNVLDRLGKDHDYRLRVWQGELTQKLTANLKGDASGTALALPHQTTATRDPDLQQLADEFLDLSIDHLAGSETEAEDMSLEEEDQLIESDEEKENGGSDPKLTEFQESSSACIYKIVGDNIDQKVKPRYMRVDKQSQMLNNFHIYGVKARVTPPESAQSDFPPTYGELFCLKLEDILPIPDDIRRLLDNYCVLFARTICNHIPFFKTFSDCVPVHIDHPYSQQMSQKSEVVPLGVLFKSEQKNEDMLEIMKAVHNYVPMVQHTTTETIMLEDAQEEIAIVQQHMHPIIFGGDQLTAERGRTIQNVVSNSDSASARLEGLVPVAEDWHAKMCLYKVIWTILYRCTSSQEGGTLFQLRNLINRRNVVKEVRNDMNATEDFFETVAVGHIIAATLQFFNMKDINDSPQCLELTEGTAKLSQAEKWAALSTSIRNLLQNYVFTSLACPHHPNFDPGTSDDSIHEYACCVLSMAMFVLEFDDAVKEGDGERVYRIWKYLLLLFRTSNRTKYALEALNLHLQHYGLAPDTAFQVMWSRFVNSKGGRGKNVPSDLHMEHLNRALKTSISGLGANITQSSVARSAKCLRTVSEVVDNFDDVNGIPYQSGKHSLASAAEDIKRIVKELHERSEVFREIPGRMHRSFPNSRRNRFSTMDWNKFLGWFDKRKEIFMEMHTKVDEDFMY